jgi:nucleobase:cation symporter-1, NCS1 family
MAGVATDQAGEGIAPIAPARAQMTWWDTGTLWFSLGVSFLVMVVGMFLVPGLSLPTALLAIVVGAVIGNLLLGLAAGIGSDPRVPTMVLMRAPLGVRGSYVPTALNVLQLLGWATFEVIVMAQAAETLATRVFGLPSAYALWVVVFTALTLAMALAGPVAVTKQWLEKFGFWAALAALAWITLRLFVDFDIGALWARPGTGTLSFWQGVDLVVALPISWFPLVADYSRFARTRRSASWGTGVGYLVPQVWLYALGAILALAGLALFDPFAPVAPLLTAIVALTAGWFALMVLLVVETDEAFANVYSASLSIQNWFPNAGHRKLIVAVCAGVLIVALAIPLTQYESFLLLIGAFFVPLLGVLAADYFVVNRQRYEASELFDPRGLYAYQGGFNVEALLIWLLGIVVYIGIAGLPIGFGDIVGPWLGMDKLVLGGLVPELGGTLPSFVVVFALHAILGRPAVRPTVIAPAQG